MARTVSHGDITAANVEWRSPDEQLPDIGCRVLVAAGSTPAIVCAHFNGRVWVDAAGFRFPGVFAWSPLPLPPSDLFCRWREYEARDQPNWNKPESNGGPVKGTGE